MPNFDMISGWLVPADPLREWWNATRSDEADAKFRLEKEECPSSFAEQYINQKHPPSQDSDLWDFYSLRIGRPGERRLYVFMMTDSDIYSIPYARVANFRLPPESERAVKIEQLLQMEGFDFENSGAKFITRPREDLVAIVNA
ncbi:hypothetical protein PHLCEN_2v2426 [Hermanssonia centrifuga]|uniref:Uncharacterized protein n=1 Tax=Hermanssonia centrifuga TaxID=98765 RepID=A0A2R6RM37_9APHY|nr:hypothetical protein PHLCEN_2v2426 [Hermanssonia centrifuga]